VLAQMLKEYPKDLRVVYRQYPLIGTPDQPFHDKAALSMQAAEAAGKQDKFWEMHDLLFEHQDEWASLSVDQYKDWLLARAGEMGLDKEKFTSDLTSEENVAKAQQAWDEGFKAGIPGTPFLLINGHEWPTNIPMSPGNLSMLIKLTLLEKRQFTSCPPVTIDKNKQYFATLHTGKGDIVIQLFPDKAPLAVNSFVFLARNGWFNGVTFHRVLENYIAQAGDPSGTGYGSPGYAFRTELSNLKFDAPGIVGMANSGQDSNGSQFFITLAPAPNLDGGYTIFGNVLTGMDIVKKLTPRDPSQPGDLPPGDVIESITIEEK
jgi:cyclophilin family peptidyl-prolyl cis-trans isomerase